MRATNYTESNFRGWVRCKTDEPLPGFPAGVTNTGVQFVVGPRDGIDTTIVDALLDLGPGQSVEFRLAGAQAVNWRRGLLPRDIVAYFGGAPRCSGQDLQLIQLAESGAGFDCHWRKRITRNLVVDFHAIYYPDQPWVRGEICVTCSNITSPDLVESLTEDLRFSFGSAVVSIPGMAVNSPLLRAGEWLADGQMRIYPVTLVWPAQATTLQQISASVDARWGVCRNGLTDLWPGGYPIPAPGNEPLSWLRRHWAATYASVADWYAPNYLGARPNSTVTGGQEDMGHPGCEATPPEGVGAIEARYFVGLHQALRPNYFCEPDGSPVDIRNYPEAVYWEGRLHYHPGTCPISWGKPRRPENQHLLGPTLEQTRGYLGTDPEHAFLNSVSIAARGMWSPAMQRMLGVYADLLERQWTVYPLNSANSSTYSSRAVAWEAMLAVTVWRHLADRERANRVREHYRLRATQIIVPRLTVKREGIWDTRRDDARLGPGDWWAPYQQAAGAYGLVHAGQVFDIPEAEQLGRAAARVVINLAWRWNGSRAETCPQQACPWNQLDAPLPSGEVARIMRELSAETGVPWSGDGQDSPAGLWNEDYNGYCMPWALAAILAGTHEPDVVAYWRFLLADFGGSPWFPPGIRI